MTQARLAETIETTQATVSRIEKGTRCPSDKLKFAIAGALFDTLEHLFPYPPVQPPAPEVAA